MDKKTLGVRALVVGLRSLSAASLALALATCSDRGHRGADDPPPETVPAMSGEVQRSSALATRPTTGVPPRAATAAVGELPGSGWVGHDGAYHYRIPIEVPPGRAGMAPSLALTYSSQGGNGPVGVGFSVEGASSITRCERVAAAGGERDRVRFQDDDLYCLDGQRLVLTSGGGGNPGDTYRTELDNFTRVTISGTRARGSRTKTASRAATVNIPSRSSRRRSRNRPRPSRRRPSRRRRNRADRTSASPRRSRHRSKQGPRSSRSTSCSNRWR